MAFFIEEVLEEKVGLIHVISGIAREMFVCASCGIRGAVECFQAGEEGTCTEVDKGWVVVEVRGGDKLADVV